MIRCWISLIRLPSKALAVNIRATNTLSSKGIGLVNCVYYNPEIDRFRVLDYRVFDLEQDGKSKLNHVSEMLDLLQFRQVEFRFCLMDSWYAMMPLMTRLAKEQKIFHCPLKINRYKRIRKRPRKQESEEVYQHKVEVLGKLESMAEDSQIDLIYTDAARVSVNAVVPYGWQFSDEDVFMPSTQGAGLNCLAFLQRNNQTGFQVTRANINSRFIFE